MRKLLLLILLMGPLAYSQNTARMLSGVNYQNGTSYIFVPSDTTKVVAFNNIAPITATLSTPTVIGLGTGIVFTVNNLGLGAVTITCSLCTINGSSSLALATGAGADIYSDGTNYTAVTGASSLIIPPSSGLCLVSTGSTPGAWSWQSCTGTASSNWNAIVPGTGTITAGTFNVGTGSTITATGSGAINATTLNSATFASPGAIGGSAASTIKGTTINATTGFQINGAAPNSHCLIGNGTNYVDSASCGGGGGSGTVTSVGLTQTGSLFTITGTPVTTAGNININFTGILPVANGGTGSSAGTVWSNLIAPTGNLTLNGYQTLLSPFTTTFVAGDFGASPLTTTGAMNFTDLSTTSTDDSPDLSCIVPTTSYHDCFLSMIDGFKQLSVYAHGVNHVGETAIGSAIDTHSLNTAAYDSKFWIMTSSHPVNTTMYDGHNVFTGTLLKLETHAPVTANWNAIAVCGSASSTDASCVTNSFTVDGQGDVTINGCGAGTYVKADGTGCGTPSGSGTITGATSGGGLVVSGSTLGLITSCTSTQVLAWSGSAWACADNGAGGGSPNYEQTFTSQTTITMLGSSHGFTTRDLLLDCYDNATPANHFQPANWTVNSSTFDVIANFASSQSGFCVLNGSGSGGSGGSNITVNGGSALTSPVNLQNGTSGNVINFSNPAGSDVQATIASSSITNAMLASSLTRTWKFSFQGVCQAGVASASVNFPVTNSPSYVACDATHITPEWQIPSTNTTDTFWVRLTVPAGHTGAYTLTTKYRSAATSGTATVQPKYACVAAGAVPDNPSFSNAGSTFTLTPAGTTLQNVVTTDTFTPTCADNADLYVEYTFTANTVASPINFSYIGLSVAGSL